MYSSDDFHELILNTRSPVVFRGLRKQMHWNCFGTSLQEWCSKYDKDVNHSVDFERMSKRCSQTPQWERKRSRVKLTAGKFLEDHRIETDFWTALHYVQLVDLNYECVQGADFSFFNFGNQTAQTTLWLSSICANTPCHYDSYGCNIVVQVYGKKSWLLFPPHTPLTSTRIPYEESSVYCYENFFAPHPNEVSSMAERLYDYAYHCVLEADDVLIVPRHWWHFVEALETSLAVNLWVPIEPDNEDQFDECIVKYLIENSFKTELTNDNDNEDTASNLIKYTLNPNQIDLINSERIHLLHMEHLHNNLKLGITTNPQSFPYCRTPVDEVDALKKKLQNHANIEEIQRLSKNQFADILKTNSERFDEQASDDKEPEDMPYVKEQLLNSLCSPIIIAAVREELCKRLDQKRQVNP